MKSVAIIALSIGLAFGMAEAQSKQGAENPAIESGSRVELEYTLTDGGGTVLDSNTGKEPLAFTQGRQQIIPGLERALDGMHAGDKKTVTVKPADAYGEVDPAAFTEVPKERIPAEALKVGTVLVAQNQSGERRSVRVAEVKESTVVIDLNHPLAGKTLVFDVKVLRVDPPSK